MKPDQISSYISAAVGVAGTLWYINLLLRHKVETIVASWAVSVVSVTLSLITYWTSPGANFAGSVLNLTSVFTIASVLAVVCVTYRRDRAKFKLSSFQKKCLVASFAITLAWIVIKWGMKGTGVIPNILTQLLLVISYVMLIKRNWNAACHMESLILWWSIFISSTIGVYTAYLKDDALAYLYAGRSSFMCAILLVALYRAEWKSRYISQWLARTP